MPSGHDPFGLADLAAGVIALAWPGPTALVLVLIVGTWAVIAGLVEFSAAFASGEPAWTRAIFILGGLITIALGVVLCARPGIGAVLLSPLIRPGTVSTVPYNHYSLLRSIEDIFGLPHLGDAAVPQVRSFGPDVFG